MSTDVLSTRPFRAPVELHQYRSTYGRGPRSACIEVTRHAASPPEPDIDGDTLKQGQ
jgi:hypothetical protein